MSYRRGWIAVFLFTLAMINYMDRIALSIAAKPIAAEFQLSAVAMGYLFSSFIWGYALFLLPMGMLIDRYGAKRMASGGILVWSAATALTGMAGSLVSLLAARLVMGAGESVSNPVCATVIRQWVPASERGVMTSIFSSGSYAGPAICSAVLGPLVAVYGWRFSFVVAGGIGFVWLAAWMIFYNVPEQARWLSREERETIVRERGNAKAVAGAAMAQQASGLRALVRSPTLWGIAIAQGCNVYTQYLFLTWLPSYLQASRGFSLAKTGVFSAVPYAAAVILCIVVGRLSDRYLKKCGVGGGGRRNAVALSMLAGAAILSVPFVNDLRVLLVVFSITLTGIASTTSLNFALLNDLLPDSSDAAKANACVVIGGNIFGMIAPIATGYVVDATGSYDGAFAIAGLLLVVGAVVILTMTRQPMTGKTRLTAAGCTSKAPI